MPSYFWLMAWLTKSWNLASSPLLRKVLILKPSFLPSCSAPATNWVVLSSDPRLRITAMRIGPLCSAIAAGTGVGAVASAAVDCSRPSVIRESAIFFMRFTL
ncbi:Uncharacterised protein [Klebsiella pneumoniae]|nr:Uncharacterised protein [Klebsiella pneumoniae]